PVAGLGRGTDRARADLRAGAAGRGPRPALPHAVGRISARTRRTARGADVDRVVVHRAVAVVVQAVASLRLRPHRLPASEALRTRARRAGAGITRPTGAGGVDAPTGAGGSDAGHVVDRAVAVVVDAVAGLGRPGDAAHAGASAGQALIGARRAPAAAAGVLAVGQVAGGAAGLTEPRVRRVVVDRAVAVVVQSVAGLGRGTHGGRALLG